MDGLTSRAVELVGCVRAFATRPLISTRLVRNSGQPIAAVALILLWGAIALPAAHAQTTAVLQGVITDRNTSLPLANVSVYNASNGVPLATTDANGSYSLTAAQLGNASSGTLYFQLATYFAVAQTFDLTQSATANATLLTGGAAIQGTISDAVIGNPLPQVPISLSFYCNFEPCTISQSPPNGGGSYDQLATVTGPDGTYQFDASLFLESKILNNQIQNAYIYTQIPGYFFNNSPILTLGSTAPRANLALIPIAGTTVSGTVTDRTTSQPLVSVQISFGSGTVVATTDVNGSFSFSGSLLNGSPGANLTFQLPGYFAAQHYFAITTTQGVVANQSLLRGIMLDGTVTDASTQAPVPGVSISINFYCEITYCVVNNPGSSAAILSTTDASGHYALDSSQFYESALVPQFTGQGSSLFLGGVQASDSGYLNQSSQGTYQALTTATTHVNLTLTPSTNFQVMGTLTDRATGLPIANAQVFTGLTFSGPTTMTDGNGKYSLTPAQINNNTQGSLTLIAPGYFIGVQAFDLTGTGTSIYSLNSTLLPGGTFLQGRVSDAATGASVDGANVGFSGTCAPTSPCSNIPGQFPNYGTFYGGAISGAGGHYAIDSSQIYENGLASLALTSVSACGAAYTCAFPSPPATPTPGAPTTMDFALTQNGITAQVTVDTSPTGLAITVDGVAATAPQTYTWIPGNEHLISTTSPQSVTPGAPPSAYFYQWDDINTQNFAQTHIIVPPSPTYLPNPSYVAFFDTQVPTIDANIAGTLGLNGWYTSTVSLSWAEGGTQFPIISTTGCDSATIASDTVGQSFTCAAVGVAGTTSSTVTIKRDTVAPVASSTLAPLPNASGWNKVPVLVHFTGTDATSGIGSCTADQTVSAEGANQSSAPGTCTDKAGNVSAAVTASGVNIDLTPPVVTGSATTPPNGAAGWYTVPVTVAFSAADALSGVAPNGCSSAVFLSADGAGQTATGSCTDVAGNVGTGKSAPLNIDRTPPVATASTSAAASYGWWIGSVTVSFTGTDSLSGSGVRGCSSPVTFTTEGAGQIASGTCTDVAGNVSAPATLTVNIDDTPPVINIATPPAGNPTYTLGSVVAASYACVDALSGVLSCSSSPPLANGAPLNTSSVGSYNLIVAATDKAGNSATLTRTYSVAAAAPTPVVTPTVSGTIGANSWYTSNVTVQWSVTSPTKILSEYGCNSQTLTQNTKGISYTCTAKNAAGTASQSVTLKRDATAPTVRASMSPGANSAGWHDEPVTITFTGTDAASGIANCSLPVTLSIEGANQSTTGDCTNNAGITGTPVTVKDSIDLTPPVLSVTVPANGAVYPHGSTVRASFTCTDSLSGVKSCNGSTTNGGALPTGTKGAKTFTVMGTDVAGNAAKATVSYTVN
jgi:hypothetical protein